MMRITSPSNPLRILLIEDSKGDAILVHKALEKAMPDACKIERAATLEEALKILASQEFDIALLDRSLPDVQGFNGLHHIQNIAPKLPVIFLTAYQDEQTALEAIKQGAQDYVFKDDLDGHAMKRAIQYAVLRKEFEGILIMRANFDMLTGLANRMLFENKVDIALAKLVRHGGNVAVFFLDLDQFKPINDTYGHAAGDTLLREVGKRLKQSLRPYDIAARFGGDEFALLLDELPDVQHSTVVAEKIIRLFDDPFIIAGKELTIAVSIGIACISERKEIMREALMQQADSAMYEAKSTPGSAFVLYDETRSVKMSERISC